jgi:hypothetical protein
VGACDDLRVPGRSSSPPASYRLDELGWLQFERLCALVLEAEAGLNGLGWLGHADSGRVALLDAPLIAPGHGLRLDGPVSVAVVWVRDAVSSSHRRSELAERLWALPSELGVWLAERMLVLTNLDGQAAGPGAARATPPRARPHGGGARRRRAGAEP